MNEDYVEVSGDYYYDLKDKSGYYKAIYTTTPEQIIYYKNDQFHRLNGPAIKDIYHTEYWIYGDKYYTKEEYYNHILTHKNIWYKIKKFLVSFAAI